MGKNSKLAMLASFITLEVLCVATCFGDVRTDFINLLRDRLPRKGAVHVVFRAEEGVGEIACGYEAQSGAWYRIDEYAVRGQDGSGRGYIGPPNPSLVKDSDLTFVGADDCLDSLLPVALLADIAARPELIRDATRIDDGYLIELEFPGGTRSQPPATAGTQNPRPKPTQLWLRTDRDCVVQNMSYESADKALRGKAATRSTAAPAMLSPVAEFDLNPWRVFSCAYEEAAPRDRFDKAVIVAAAVELKMRLAKEIAGSGSPSPNPGLPAESSESGTYDPSTDHSMNGISVGVGAVGGVLLVVGLAAWIRRRKLATDT
ncbi:MAG: hypothetical protein NTV94_05425 [Planctomycetota bacterium]|nr:hypothetical protein [Planctomycetota bacterium]